MKVYGPYTRNDKRQHVIVIYDDGSRKTVSYPKFLLEQKIGRVLLPHETCDHIDGDLTNNNLENLQVLSRSENSTKAMALKKAEQILFVCPECGISFYKNMWEVRANQLKKKQAGPFCSKSCAGRYGQKQNKTFRGGRPNPCHTGAAPE
jgi:hypothetical protein